MQAVYTILTGVGVLYGAYLIIGAIGWGIYHTTATWFRLDTQWKAVAGVTVFGVLLALAPARWAILYALVFITGFSIKLLLNGRKQI